MNADTFLDKVKKNTLNYNDYLYQNLEYSPYAESLEKLLVIGEALNNIKVDGEFYVSDDFAVHIGTCKLYLTSSKDFEIAVAKYNYNCDTAYLHLSLFAEVLFIFLCFIFALLVLYAIISDGVSVASSVFYEVKQIFEKLLTVILCNERILVSVCLLVILNIFVLTVKKFYKNEGDN